LLNWFSVPRSVAEFAQECELAPQEVRYIVQAWVECGWLSSTGFVKVKRRGKPSEFFVLKRLPRDSDEILRPKRRSVEEKVVDGERARKNTVSLFDLFEHFHEPVTIADVALQSNMSVVSVTQKIAKHLEDGRVFYAGKRRPSRGPPATRYCSDRTKARRGIWEWLVSEYDRLDGRARAMGTELLLGWPISEDGTPRADERTPEREAQST
jgi:hypothetical protein